jgi:YD repeat-containing protein
MRERFLLLLAMAGMALIVRGQEPSFTRSLTDGSTPPGMAPGAPAGSFPLSGFDTVNLFNGNLNFRLPLLEIGGRGEARYTVTLKVEHHWRIETEVYAPDYVRHTAVPAWWNSFEAGYGPGLLMMRTGADVVNCAGGGTVQDQVLTRFTFVSPDGAELELRDKQTDGRPHLNPLTGQSSCTGETPTNRGTEFVTADGSAATFYASTPILDAAVANPGEGGYETMGGNGTLVFRDGLRYDISNGRVERIRDRNGNRVWFEQYDELNRVKRIRDPLDRVVTITYGISDGQGFYDEIRYQGYEPSPRVIKVRYSTLAAASGMAVATYDQLFPQGELNPQLLDPPPNPTVFNPNVVSEVELPNGRKYVFRYNQYQELVRVELPTGGAIEYVHGSGLGASSHGVYLGAYGMVYRRVQERHVKADGSTLARRTVFTENGDGSVTVTDYDAGTANILRQRRHWFYSDPRSSAGTPPFAYPQWRTGREYQIEEGAPALRRIEHTWQQRACSPWYPFGNPCSLPEQEPPIDPRIVETKTTLVDTGQLARQTFGHDQYNNVTDTWERDWGASGYTRHTRVSYETSPSYTGAGAHLRSLPLGRTVRDGSGAIVAETMYTYDESAPQPRANMTGYVAPGHNYRGNATKVKRWLNPGNQWLETRRTYDEAGNVLTETDPRNHATTIGYADAYDGTQPPGPTFAFPTTVTNALSHAVSRRYDYATGQVTRFTDANGVETTFSYEDPLDRLRTVVRASGHADARVRTTHTYDDALPGVTTSSDQYLEYDQRLVSTVVFDGLGRQIKTRTQTGSGTIEVWREYDGVDRVRRVSQPGLGGPGAYTATGYDTLDRVVTVTHPDGSVARTGYRGNVAMATDENGRRRKSTVDALGRLAAVVEHPSCEAWESGCSVTGALDYSTSYTYDVLDNLTGVTQGAENPQTRTFGYDSLGRLICSSNPETRVGSASCVSLPASGVERYTYDGNGNLLTKKETRNITVSHTYDAGNRLEFTSYSSGAPAVRRCYDGRTYSGGVCTGNEVSGQKGRLTAVGNEVSATQFTYHPVGWVTASTQVVAGVAAYGFEYGYYRDGRLARQVYPSSRSVVTCYDRAGRVGLGQPGAGRDGGCGGVPERGHAGGGQQLCGGSRLSSAWGDPEAAVGERAVGVGGLRRQPAAAGGVAAGHHRRGLAEVAAEELLCAVRGLLQRAGQPVQQWERVGAGADRGRDPEPDADVRLRLAEPAEGSQRVGRVGAELQL